MYKILIKPILFILPPEKAHNVSVTIVKILFKFPVISKLVNKLYSVKNQQLVQELFGLKFTNPVGLAAGFDKNADFFNEFSNFGFGFIEIGTVTPKPQDGNPKPRLFRLPKDKALINRMGFNNAGVKKVVENLKKRKTNIIIGGNIGKNKVTPNENAADDYICCFNNLYPYVDYFVVNVSSPNTPNLRELQDKEPLTELLNKLQAENQKKEKRKPILLKIAPDLSFEQLDDIIDIVKSTKIDGVIATNTTIERTGLKTSKEIIDEIGPGGLSGKPLLKRSTEVIQYLKQKSQNAFPVIGVGGITKPEDALEKINAGADLVQIYTGFIYEGPGLIKKINKLLSENFSQNENN
jgi:dihydroorotate dehydrogenase